MAVAFLAVASVATSAPLNPLYSAREFDFYLADVPAKALIVLHGSDALARAVARTHKIPIIELSPMPDAAAGCFRSCVQTAPSPGCHDRHHPCWRNDDVALVLHTSGTTSRPKTRCR